MNFLSFQPKYEAALEHPDLIKIVTPDWVTDCVQKTGRQDEKIYHPRLVVYPKPESPPKPETPQKLDAMEVNVVPDIIKILNIRTLEKILLY